MVNKREMDFLALEMMLLQSVTLTPFHLPFGGSSDYIYIKKKKKKKKKYIHI